LKLAIEDEDDENVKNRILERFRRYRKIALNGSSDKYS
jgi:hypothetical protein